VATIATTMAVMAKTSLVFRLKAGIIHFLMREVAAFSCYLQLLQWQMQRIF
jgi:hypothetical protein